RIASRPPSGDWSLRRRLPEMPGTVKQCLSGRVDWHSRSLSMRPLPVLSTAALAVLTASARAQTKAIQFDAVYARTGRMIPSAVVTVEGDKTTRIIQPHDPLPAGAQKIDMSRYIAIPGMIDAHTHMTYTWDPASGTDPWRQPPKTPEQAAAL